MPAAPEVSPHHCIYAVCVRLLSGYGSASLGGLQGPTDFMMNLSQLLHEEWDKDPTEDNLDKATVRRLTLRLVPHMKPEIRADPVFLVTTRINFCTFL